jgi:hypothetical protein
MAYIICVFFECPNAVAVPIEFAECLHALRDDLALALDCVEIFGDVPVPVAEAILRSIEPVTAGLDLAIKNRRKEAADEHREVHIAG